MTAEWLPAPTHEDRARAQAFERDGFCVLPPGDGLSPAEVRELQGAFARQAVGPRRAFEAAGSANHKGQRIFDLPQDFMLSEDAFVELVVHRRLLAVVAELVGVDVQLQEVFTRCYTSAPGSAGYLGWHHDDPTSGCWRWVKVQVLLSDVAEDGGAFCVVPRTHHRADTDCDDPAFHPASSAGYLGKVDEPVPEAVKMALPAGTIVIFDTHLHHTALANTSGVDRDSIFLSYTPFWCKQTGNVARIARQLDAAGRLNTPLRRQMLGVQTDSAYTFTGPGFSRGMYGAWPDHDSVSAQMAPWVGRLLEGAPQTEACARVDGRTAARDRAAFAEHSYVRMEGILSGAELREAVQAFADCPAATAPGVAPGGPEEGRYVAEPALRRAFCHPRILALAAAALQQPVALVSAFSRRYHPAGCGGRGTHAEESASGYSPWHRDFPPGVERFIKVQLLLSDCESDGGCMCLVPGTATAEHPTADAQGEFFAGLGVDGERQEEMAGMRRMTGAAGTAIVFDTRVYHTALPNTSARPRDSIFFSFSSFWQKQTTMLSETVRALDRRGAIASPLERQVLGLELAGSIHWEEPAAPQPRM